MRKFFVYIIFLNITLEASLNTFAFFENDITAIVNAKEQPQVLTVPNPNIYNVLLEDSKIIVPTKINHIDVISEKRKPVLRDFASLTEGTLMKFVICSSDPNNKKSPLIMRAGSKKESQKLALEATIVSSGKPKKKIKSLHHSTLNSWAPIKTGGVLYLTKQRTGKLEILVSIESGKYGLDRMLPKDAMKRVRLLKELQQFFKSKNIISKLITGNVWVEEENPNSLLQFPEDKKHSPEIKTYQRKKALLTIQLE